MTGTVGAVGAPAAARAGVPPGVAPPTSTEPSVTLEAQDPFTPVGGSVGFRFDIANAPEGATLNFGVFQPLTTRSAFDNLVDGGALGTVVSQLSIPVADIPVDPITSWRVVELGLQSPSAARDFSRLNVRTPGVYPLRVDLVDDNGTTPVATPFVTTLVVSPADDRPPVPERLNVVWVWPLVAAPSYGPNGEPDREVTAQFLPDERLGRQAVALGAVPDVPVTLVVGPETLEAWSQDPLAQGGAEAIVAATRTHQTLGNPYVPIDLPSLLQHGLTAAVDEELGRGFDVLAYTLGAAPDTRTRLVRPVSAPALERLKASGIDRVIVDGAALTAPSVTSTTAGRPTLTPASVATVRVPRSGGGSETVEALATDVGFQKVLTSDVDAPLRAQLLLGGLTVVANELPSSRRVITLVNPDDFVAPSAFYTALLGGLRNNPYLQPVSAEQGFASATDSPASAPPVDRELVSNAVADPRVLAVAYDYQRARLNALDGLTLPNDPTVAHADRSLLASVTSAWPPDAGRALAMRHFSTVDRAVDHFVRLIEVPNPRTITLTSRSGAIPLTFRNETGRPVRIRAVLVSDKLLFPEGSVLDLELPPKSSTWRVAVETRTSGTFPIKLEVTSTDGVLPISHRRLEVRSTFVSTLGIVLMASAVLFLAVWWGFDLRRRRRRRTQTAES
jgi:hypothetical protein